MSAEEISTSTEAKQAYVMGVQAYIWGYPMVVMQRSRDAMTKGGDAPVTADVFNKTGQYFAPVNQVATAWGMLGPKYTAVQSGKQRHPVFRDVVYDVIRRTVHPGTCPMPRGGTTRTSSSTRGRTTTTTPARARWGPRTRSTHWSPRAGGASCPTELLASTLPTPTGFIIGRWYVADQVDVSAVNALQQKVTMTPLGKYGTSYTPPKVPVVAAKDYSGQLGFFEQLGDTLAINGAPAADDGLLGLLGTIGLSVDHGFDASGLSDDEKKALVQAAKDGEEMLAAASAGLGTEVNGWQLAPVLDAYFGTDYMTRAAIGYQAMFENTPIEAYYPSVFNDVDGKVLDGSKGNYTMRFEKGKTPPVGAFWSTSMYDAKRRLMVVNPIDRYKIGSADNLTVADDGSTTLYIQAESPGKEREGNWLPAPKEPFYMLFRMYLPDIQILNGQYDLPGVKLATS